jgi:hypothetical protein
MVIVLDGKTSIAVDRMSVTGEEVIRGRDRGRGRGRRHLIDGPKQIGGIGDVHGLQTEGTEKSGGD